MQYSLHIFVSSVKAIGELHAALFCGIKEITQNDCGWIGVVDGLRLAWGEFGKSTKPTTLVPS
jgi:hypothetical protein